MGDGWLSSQRRFEQWDGTGQEYIDLDQFVVGCVGAYGDGQPVRLKLYRDQVSGI